LRGLHKRCRRSYCYALDLCFDMRAIWKGSIAFGLVHIPVNLYPATESHSISSNLLHKKDHSRIRYQRVSEATGKEVPAQEIVRGFEVERDNFVVISDDELKEAAPEKSDAIEIQEFVDEFQIPTLYFEKPYYLEPDKGAGKAYALLREALSKSGKVGVAQFVLRNRESLCVLKAQGNALTLNTLRFASEIRSAEELRLPVNEQLVPNEVNLALKLIEGMTAEFDPAKYHDTYTEDVKKLIEDKAKGQKRQAPPPKPVRSNVIDLVAALQESLVQKKPRKRGAA
jgi:DNA end-binding protein Ku